MSVDDEQKKYEMMISKKFLEILNRKFKTDCEAILPIYFEIPNSANMPDIDVVAKSKANLYPPIYLQLTDDIELDSLNKNEISAISPPLIFDCDPLRAIIKKEKKYKNQGREMREITLLISGSYDSNDLRQQIADSKIKINEIRFRDVYFISKPAIASNRQGINEKREWYVFPIKSSQILNRNDLDINLDIIWE